MSHRKVKRNKKKNSKRPVSSEALRGKESSVQFPRPETNRREQMIVVPEFPLTDPRSLISRSPQGSQGVYYVTFILSIPGQGHFRDELDLNKLMQSGDALLLIPQEATQVNVRISNDKEAANVTISKNARGALSKAHISVHASNFVEAEAQAFNLVMPLLSRWSYLYDLALDIMGYHVYEEQTDTQKWTFNLIGKEKFLNFGIIDVSKPAYRTVFSAYREAVNATNTFYQLLCFYRVIEGVKKLRTRRKEATLATGKEYREPSGELIPDAEGDCGSSDLLVQDAFKPYLGKRFTWVLDQMRGLFRNAIAHLDPEGSSLIADKFEDVAKCEQALPVIKYISRLMLRNELLADPDYSKVHFN